MEKEGYTNQYKKAKLSKEIATYISEFEVCKAFLKEDDLFIVHSRSQHSSGIIVLCLTLLLLRTRQDIKQ